MSVRTAQPCFFLSLSLAVAPGLRARIGTAAGLRRGTLASAARGTGAAVARVAPGAATGTGGTLGRGCLVRGLAGTTSGGPGGVVAGLLDGACGVVACLRDRLGGGAGGLLGSTRHPLPHRPGAGAQPGPSFLSAAQHPGHSGSALDPLQGVLASVGQLGIDVARPCTCLVNPFAQLIAVQSAARLGWQLA